MEDSEALKQMIAQSLEHCNDYDTLDLVYKLLNCDNATPQPSQRERSPHASTCLLAVG